MKQDEALTILKAYNAWINDDTGEVQYPKEIGQAIDVAIRVLSKKQEPVFTGGEVYTPWTR
jgi:hypothetical protein